MPALGSDERRGTGERAVTGRELAAIAAACLTAGAGFVTAVAGLVQLLNIAGGRP